MKCALVVLLVLFSSKCRSDATFARVEQLESTLSELQQDNGRLTAQCDLLREENKKMWTELGRLAQQVRELQQLARADNVEIAGVPQLPGEDLYQLLERISAALDLPFDRRQISEVHRLPKQGRQGPPPIVVRFVSRRTCDRWLAAGRAASGRDVRRVFPNQPSAPFFVNPHLTPYKKGLLDTAKRLVDQGVYAFAWAKDGKVYARRTATSHVIRIRTFEDFDHEDEAVTRTKHLGSYASNKTQYIESKYK